MGSTACPWLPGLVGGDTVHMPSVDEGPGAIEESSPRRLEDPYAAIWQMPEGSGAERFVQDQLASWLRQKNVDVDLRTTATHRLGNDRLFVGHRSSSGAAQFQARLIEHNAQGTWRTELTTHAPRGEPGWLRLRVVSDRGAYVARPRLASFLLAGGQFRDGGALELTEHPTLVSLRLTQEVAEVITDFTREGLVFVAGTDDALPFDDFYRMVQRWTRDVVGLAEVYVLDPMATREMADILGESHAVAPWTIRTFLPDVDPAVEDNARFHRWLGTERLAHWSDARIQRTLGRIARGHAEARPLPEHVMASLRAFVAMENQLLVDSVGTSEHLASRLDASPSREGVDPSSTTVDAAGPSDSPVHVPQAATGSSAGTADVAEEAEQYLHALELVRRVLDVPEVSEDSLRAFMLRLSEHQQQARFELAERLAEQSDEIGRLNGELAQYRRLLEDAELDLAILQEERDDLADIEQWLRRELKSGNQPWLASAPLPDEERTGYPTSFQELLEWLSVPQFPNVVFTGDSGETSVLDLHQGLDVALRTAHDVLLALRDFARARKSGWAGNVETYLQHPPDGCRGIPRKKHAISESATVLGNERMARMRNFPVPVEVSPQGSIQMTAHFKLGLAGNVSPRLYYFDDTARSGNVYVGYIGPHLLNTKTN